ncbi:MAG TPA: hypothetical protein VF507_03465 [Pyrinomonadaceae bacterium]|jgi:hypothetical protein
MTPKKSSGLKKRTSRRSFTKSVATALVAAPLAARLAHAQDPSKKEAPAPPKPQPSPSPQKPSPVAEAYAEVARARFGDKLTPEQFEQVKRSLNNSVNTADRLRAFKLKNEEEPDFIFSAV